MKKLLLLLSFLSTSAMAIDRPIPCTGNSCKLLFETVGSGGAKVSAGNASGTGAWTLGVTTGASLTHTLNDGANGDYKIGNSKFYGYQALDVATAGMSIYGQSNAAGGTRVDNAHINLYQQTTATLGGMIEFYTHNGTALAKVGDVKKDGSWNFRQNTPAVGTPLTAYNNDSSSNPTGYFENSDTTSDSATTILQLKFGGDSDASGGRYIKFSDQDSTEIGSITSNSATAVAFNAVSDRRLKHNIRPIENALGRVLRMKPSQFNWNEDGHHDEGFIAQELKKVYPTAVTGKESDGIEKPMQVDYGKVTPLLAAAIIEQQKIIEKLSARLSALEGN